MKVTDEHLQRASRPLVAHPGDESPPHFRGYLAAVERTCGPPTENVVWQDLEDAPGTAWVENGAVWIDLDPEDEDAMVHALYPSEARRRAYELLVLADIAEGATSRAK